MILVLLEREGVGVKSNYYCPESMKYQMSQVIEKLMRPFKIPFQYLVSIKCI